MKKRLGIIKVSGVLYHQPELMQKIFKYMIPIRTEFQMHNNVIKILAEGEQFDEVIEGSEIPQYLASFVEIDKDNTKVIFEKD